MITVFFFQYAMSHMALEYILRITAYLTISDKWKTKQRFAAVVVEILLLTLRTELIAMGFKCVALPN